MRDDLKKYFSIELDKIEEDKELFKNIEEAIAELNKWEVASKYEVILNNNLIKIKDKYNNFRTILGCRISYDNLDKNVSFIVREDKKPSYEKLEQEIQRLNNIIDKIFEFMQNKYDNSDLTGFTISFMELEELKELKEGK